MLFSEEADWSGVVPAGMWFSVRKWSGVVAAGRWFSVRKWSGVVAARRWFSVRKWSCGCGEVVFSEEVKWSGVVAATCEGESFLYQLH